MAGIGFELRRAIRNKSLASKGKGYFSAAFTCFGGMLIGIVLIAALRIAAVSSGISMETNNLFMSLTTNTMFVSMMITALFSMLLSRYVSDKLFLRQYEKIMPSFIGETVMALGLGAVVYGTMLAVSYTPQLPVVELLLLFISLSVCWCLMNYISLLRDYKHIVFAFLSALAGASVFVVVLRMNSAINLSNMLLTLFIAYSIVDVWLFRILNHGFPVSNGSIFDCFRYIIKYPLLIVIGFMLELGILGHFWITWAFDETSIHIGGLFALNLSYDFPAIVAYFSTIPALIYFVTLFETDFYVSYKTYLEKLGESGSAAEVEESRNSMILVLRKGIRNYSAIQIVVCLLFITIVGKLLAVLNIGMTERMLQTFRMFCVGFALFSVANVLLLLQLYFVDEKRAAICSSVFAFACISVTVANILCKWEVHGIGLFLSSLMLLILSAISLSVCTGKLEKHILCDTEFADNEPVAGIRKNRSNGMKAETLRPKRILFIMGYCICAAVIAFSGLSLIETSKRSSLIYSFQPERSEEVQRRPGVGFAPWANSEEAEDMDTTLVYVEIKWADWEPEQGVFDTEFVETEYHLSEYRADNKQVVFRFVCDEPTDERHMDIPQWLYDATGDGYWYETGYGMGYSPDYSNELFIEAHKNAIAMLGAQYGKDDFFHYIEIGSLGHWGEYHVNISEGVPPLPLYETRIRYIEPYLSAFPNAHFLMRYPLLEASKYGFGLFNDMTGDYEETEYWLEQMGGGVWDQTNEPEQVDMKDTWADHPIAGEFASTHDDSFFVETNLLETIDLLKASHQSIIGPKTIVGEEGYAHTKAEARILSAIGYQYRVVSAVVDLAEEDTVSITATFTNDGNAPIYDYYETQLIIRKSDGKEIDREELPGFDLRELLPGENRETNVVLSSSDWDDEETYILTVSVVDKNGSACIPLYMSDYYQDKEYYIGEFRIQ